MSDRTNPRARQWSRRAVLGLASAAIGVLAEGVARRGWSASEARRLRADDPDVLPPFERQHLPVLRLPVIAGNGAKVPIVVEMAHPMEPGHYIASVEVINGRDPIPSKGVFHLGPANGQMYLSFQARMDHGISEVSVIAECAVHGRWSSARAVNIPQGGGGCADPPIAARRLGEDDVRPPAIRIPQLLKRGRIRPGEIVLVQLVTRHPNRTGLELRDGEFVQAAEPFYLTEVEVIYGGERVSRFELTPALSDDPFISFPLRVSREGPLLVRLTNNRGQRFEATHHLRFGSS
jgi:desulfoferrodoxin (superoxide reductase-like protein)